VCLCVTKKYGRMEVKLHTFLTRALAEGENYVKYLKSLNTQQNRVHNLSDDRSMASFQNTVV